MFIDNILQIATTAPDRVALLIDEQAYDYQYLLHRASIVADWLTANSVTRLGICADRSVGNYVGIMACLLAGCAYVPLNLKLPSERLDAIKQQAQLDALFEEALFDFSQPSQPPRVIDVDMNQWVYMMFTSGSTGVPKGVPVTYAQLDTFISMMQQHHQLTADDRVAQHADMSFDMSVYDIFMAWNAGACLCVVPESQRLAPAKFIQDTTVTVWFSVPSIIGFMKQLKLLSPNSLPSLRLSLFSGEPLLVGDALDWQQAAANSFVDNLYGPTEATVECMAYRLDASMDMELGEQSILPIGEPLPGNTIALLDKDGQWVVDDQPGELLIAGPQIIAEYWDNPQLTAEKLIQKKHPDYGDQCWYRTGDQVYRDRAGCCHYLGRLDNQVKIQGHRVELEEVEHYLRQVTGCLDVAAVIVADERGDHLYGALEDPSLDQKVVKQQLLQLLPFYMVPEQVVSVEQLPRSLNGKLDRRALIEMLT